MAVGKNETRNWTAAFSPCFLLHGQPILGGGEGWGKFAVKKGGRFFLGGLVNEGERFE